jgi:uncharacterized membrane protein YpjA
MTADKIPALIAVFALVTLILFVPALIAVARRHPDRKLIGRLSPLTLVSFVLWAALLVWAVSDQRDDAVISRYVARLRGSRHFSMAIGFLVMAGAAGTAWSFLA